MLQPAQHPASGPSRNHHPPVPTGPVEVCDFHGRPARKRALKQNLKFCSWDWDDEDLVFGMLLKPEEPLVASAENCRTPS